MLENQICSCGLFRRPILAVLGGMALPDGALVRKEKDGLLSVIKLKRGVCARCITACVTPCLHESVRVFLPCFCLESPYSFRKETLKSCRQLYTSPGWGLVLKGACQSRITIRFCPVKVLSHYNVLENR